MRFDHDGFINLNTPGKTLKKGEKAIRKLEHDGPHLSSEMRFKKESPIENFHHPHCN